MNRPMEHRFTILVPLDGSSYGEAILGSVAALAGPLRARVVLLSVAAPALDPDRPAAHGAPGWGQARPAVAHAPTATAAGVAEEERLSTYLRRCAAELPGAATELVVDVADQPAHLIIARARQEHADLIAMATHGRTGLGHLLVGSVCETVIRSGVAPVLVLRP